MRNYVSKNEVTEQFIVLKDDQFMVVPAYGERLIFIPCDIHEDGYINVDVLIADQLTAMAVANRINGKVIKVTDHLVKTRSLAEIRITNNIDNTGGAIGDYYTVTPGNIE